MIRLVSQNASLKWKSMTWHSMAFNSKHEWLKNPFFWYIYSNLHHYIFLMPSIKAMGLPQPLLFSQERHFSGECLSLHGHCVLCLQQGFSHSDCPLRLALSPLGKKSPRCSLDSIIYSHSGHHSLHCLTSYSWPIDGETLCASWWSLQRSLQRPYFHFKSPSHQYTDQKKEAGGKEAGFLTLRHVSHFTERHDLLYDFMKRHTILEQTTNHRLETKCLLGLTGWKRAPSIQVWQNSDDYSGL